MDNKPYLYLRNNGLNHEEALDLHKNNIDIAHYEVAKHGGATHKEILDAVNNGIGVYGYGAARMSGATHEETLDAFKKGISPYDYAGYRAFSVAKNVNATHEEILNFAVAHKKISDEINDLISSRLHEINDLIS